MRYYSRKALEDYFGNIGINGHLFIDDLNAGKVPSIEIPEQNGKLVNIREVRDKMIKYGFTAPDMTVTEFVEDELTAVLEASEVKMRERMKAILTGHRPRQLANNPIPPNVAPAYMPNSEVKE